MRLARLAAILPLLLACGVGGAPSTRAQQPRATSDARASACTTGADARIDALGAAFLRSSPAVGLSLGVHRDGTSECYDFGASDRASGAPVTPRTAYEIGSLTKTFTSTLLAQAVREGRLKLDDDIRGYLPEPYPNLEYEGRPIRIVHLANLTSELPNWLPDRPELFTDLQPEAIPAAIVALHRGYRRADFYRDLHHVTLSAAPGSRPRHSNAAAQLLAFILEDLYGRPYEALLRERITRPLGMERTASHARQPPASLAKGYDDRGAEMPYLDMHDVQASGGLTSTTEDMLKYVAFQLDETNEAVELSHRVTVSAADDTVALNWHVDRSPDGTRKIWHTGGTFGFSSYVVLYPERELGIVLLANESDPLAQGKLVDLADGVAQLLAAGSGGP
jgi:CubicO group peptidase (beta-lactamase class C family)